MAWQGDLNIKAIRARVEGVKPAEYYTSNGYQTCRSMTGMEPDVRLIAYCKQEPAIHVEG